MKAVDIALNDLRRAFRNAFALVFMFVIPLLLTGMMYLMFGNAGSDDTGFNLPRTQVVIANLDEGGPGFDSAMTGASGLPGQETAGSLGDLIVSSLESEGFAGLMAVTRADSAETARGAVDDGQAGVALVIPADFSRRFFDEQAGHAAAPAVLEFYQDPTLTLGPAIVRSVLNQFMDGFSGAKIAVQVLLAHSPNPDPALISRAVQEYVAATTPVDGSAALVETRGPAAQAPQEQPNLLGRIAGSILTGMLVFYAFFTGTSTAQTILKEDEEGTLARLFTTPTPRVTILTGKFLSVFLTVLVQVVVLLILGRLLFGIEWGELATLLPVVVGTVVIAATFGIFVNSLLKSTRQGGIVFGAVLTVTGMVGMIKVFTLGAVAGPALDIASLAVPQGWAVRGFLQAAEGLPPADGLITLLVMLAWSAVFFAIGVWRFNRRYA